jgi:surfeit locus 1 family protein
LAPSSRFVFRPLIGLSIATVLMLAFLIGLGVWQLERLQWKLDLIAQVERAMKAAPVGLETAMRERQALPLAGRIAQADYRRVRVTGHFAVEKEVYFFTTAPDGSPALHVIAPFVIQGACSGSCAGPQQTILVDRGYVPFAPGEPRARSYGAPEGERAVVGILRASSATGYFTPPPDRPHRTFYARDLAAMAGALGVQHPFPMFLDADATPNPGGWPKGGQTQITFRNEHLQYAITWFSLAFALLCIYLIYHASKGRLAFRPGREDR